MVNWIGILEELSGKTGWEDANGPDSGVGESYWYALDDDTFARLNIDQDYGYLVLIEGQGEDTTEKTLWEGEVDELSNDPALSKFVVSDEDQLAKP